MSAPAQAAPEKSTAALTPDKPTPPAPAAPEGKVRRVGGISLKVELPKQAAAPKQEKQEELPPLDQPTLHKYWDELLEQMKTQQPKLAEILAGREVRHEEDDKFAIVLPNAYLEAEVKPHLVEMLQYLRGVTKRPMLNCHIVVEVEVTESKIYMPRDKYDAMVKANPNLEAFRMLFPEVDF